MKKWSFLAAFLLPFLSGEAAVRLPAVFTDNMVLQRNEMATIWGWAGPSAYVKVVGSWSPQDTVTTQTDNYGRWSLSLRTTEAGGPYTLTLWEEDQSERTILQNVLLGEVWICSGQSNMEWSANHGILNGEAEAATARDDRLRILHVAKTGAATPQDDCPGAWAECTPETMRSTSAIGYFFARELRRRLDVPVGIIVAAWGGTQAEVWIPREKILEDSVLAVASTVRSDFPWWPRDPGAAYNGMIRPLMPYAIAGAIWYQGESNVLIRQAPSYDRLIRTLIASWREGFGKEIPFYYVQIAPYIYKEATDRAHVVREQQANTLAVPRTGMVVIWDLVDDIKNIHPINKQDVGLRLAREALMKTYSQWGPYIYQSYKAMHIEGEKIRIYFTAPSYGLRCDESEIKGFTIAGEERCFVPAEARIEGETLVVWAKEVKKPVAVRFLFDNRSIGNLFSRDGLPVCPFRTDSYPE